MKLHDQDDKAGVTAIDSLPGNSVLLVIDAQIDFVTGSLGSTAAASTLEKIIEKASSFIGQVILTKDTHEEYYLNTQEGLHLPVEHCIRGTEGWEFPDKLERLVAERRWRVWEKPSFGSIELAESLVRENERQAIDAIEIIGYCTDICVISAALILKAALPETPIRVLPECCAGTSPEAHQQALAVMQNCQIIIGGSVPVRA